jgi:hypothetical protein
MIYILEKVSDMGSRGPLLSIRWYRYRNRAGAFQEPEKRDFFAAADLKKR